MNQAMDYHTAKALLEWQIELGADEAICEGPVNRYELDPTPPKPAAAATKPDRPAKPVVAPEPTRDEIAAAALAKATQLAQGADSLDALRAALQEFDACDLKRGARNLVFGDGNTAARIMVIADGPNRDEDRQGIPMVTAPGALFDKMFAAIGKSRDGVSPEASVYVTCAVPWCPPHNRAPTAGELDMLRPFLARQVALVDPDLIILMGNGACEMAIQKTGVRRLRGTWIDAFGKPAMPMLHPDALLRTPLAKRDAWADLLAVNARLNS